MKIHVVVHGSLETQGAYETWAAARSYSTWYFRVHQAQPLRQSVDDIDLRIVMGAPQDPATIGL